MSKPGSFFSTPIDQRPWSTMNSNPINGSLTNKTKKKLNPIIQNEIFDQILPYLNLPQEEYWLTVFKQCSFGKFPKGFSFKNNILYYKYKKEPLDFINLPTPSEDPKKKESDLKQCCAICLEFFKRKTTNCEENEHNVDKLVPKEKEYTKWSEIKKKKIKDTFLFDYTTELKAKYNLTNEEFMSLQTIIKIGLSLGLCNKLNISILNNKIDSIQGLVFDEKNRIFDFDYKNIKKPSKSNVSTRGGRKTQESTLNKKKENNFPFLWKKYINSFRNKSATTEDATESTISDDEETESQTDYTAK